MGSKAIFFTATALLVILVPAFTFFFLFFLAVLGNPNIPDRLLASESIGVISLLLFLPMIFLLFKYNGYRRQFLSNKEELSSPGGTQPLRSVLADISFAADHADFKAYSLVGGVNAVITRNGGSYTCRLRFEKGVRVQGMICGAAKIHTTSGRGTSAFFTFADSTPCPFEVNEGEGGGTELTFSSQYAFPCEGYMNELGQAYLLSPAFKVSLEHERDVALMLLEPASRDWTIAASKSDLSVMFKEAGGRASLTAGKALEGYLQASGRGFEWVRLVLHRIRPGLNLSRWNYIYEMSEIVGEQKTPGETRFSWTPTKPNFAPAVWIFNPVGFGFGDLNTLVTRLGAGREAGLLSSRYKEIVFGEGKIVHHQLWLILHPTRRREVNDKAVMTLN